MHAWLNNYKVFLTHAKDTRRVYPVQKNATLQDVPEDGKVFKRRRIKEDLTFSGEDFQWLLAIENGSNRCADIFVRIDLIVPGGTDITVYNGIGSADGCDFDLDGCSVIMKVDDVDKYGEFYKIWDRSINVLNGTTKVCVNTNFVNIASPITTFDQYDIPPETITAGPSGSNVFLNPDFPDPNEGWVMITDEVKVDNGAQMTRYTRFGRERLLSGTPPANPYFGFMLSPLGVWYRAVSTFEIVSRRFEQRDTFGSLILEYYLDNYRKYYSWVSKDVDAICNGMTLISVFDRLLAGTGYTVKSNYLNLNPSGPSPANTLYAAADHQDNIIYQKTDILLPTASNPATILNMTLKELLEQLWAKYFTPWVLIGNTLVVEHESFFEGNQGIDLTLAPYAVSLRGNKAYSYDRSEEPSGEEFYEAEEAQCQPAFQKFAFSYNLQPSEIVVTNCIRKPGGVKSTVAERVCSDVQSMFATPENFSTAGWVIVGTSPYAGQRMIDVITSIGPADGVVNGRNAPIFLQVNWYYRRYFKYGRTLAPFFDSSLLVFASLVRYKKQKQITIKLRNINDFDAMKEQKTQFGWAEVSGSEYSLYSGTLTFIPLLL